MDGIEKLQTEVEEMNDYNIANIFEYLKTRKDLYDKFNNEEKSIQEMYDYICGKARNLAKNNVAMVNDKVVYLWAVTYFNKSNEELKIKKKEKPTETKTIVKDEKPKETEEVKKEDNQISMFEEVQE